MVPTLSPEAYSGATSLGKDPGRAIPDPAKSFGSTYCSSLSVFCVQRPTLAYSLN